MLPSREVKGWEFEKKGFQERNLENLMGILSKKEVTEALTVIGKTEKETWKNIAISVIALNEFVSLGGMSSIANRVSDVVELQIDRILSPLKNELNQLFIDAFGPLLDKITIITNDLSQFIADNPEGAVLGGLIGAFLPGGAITAVLGALIGAALQDFFQGIMGSVGTISPSENPSDPHAVARYQQETGRFPSGPWDVEYLQWWAETYHGLEFT